jgi:DNA mismatch repair protein MutS2
VPFDPGAHVHVVHFGKGVVREARNGGRYLVEVKGSAMVVTESQLSAVDPPKRARSAPAASLPALVHAASSIDLHGRTVPEAEADLDQFINDALLAGLGEVRVIHGRSGGRLKAAVHARLRELPSVRGFFVDTRNEGVTIVHL